MRAFLALIVVVAFSPSIAVAADKVTNWGYITQLRSGIIEDSMAVFLDVPVLNTGCTTTIFDGYVTSPDDAGHKLFHATLLGAYFNNKQVQLVLRGCAYSKPRIVAVFVKD